MTLEFESQEDLYEKTRRLIVTLGHVRYWEKKYKTHFGSTNRAAMVNWQQKADELIRDLQIEDQDLNSRISVKVKTPHILSNGVDTAIERKD